MTTLAALSNFGRQLPDTLSLFLENYLPWTILGIIGWLYAISYLRIVGKTIKNLGLKEKEE